MIKLYDYYRSSACFRVRIALNLKNLPYEAIPIHLLKNGGEQFSAVYETINSQNLVPSLQDGNFVLTQSLAIIEYLEEKHPSPTLFPEDLQQRSLAKAFALTIIADTHPLNNLRVLTYLTSQLNFSDENKTKWIHHWIQKSLAALEKQLTKTNLSAHFCFGYEPTIADICLIPQMYNARRFHCDTNAYPILERIDQHCQKLDAFTKAWPKETA